MSATASMRTGSNGGASRNLLEEVRNAANGLLPAAVYQKLHDLGRLAGGGTFVEIGTAHGAATIALALGAKTAGKPFHIYTVDPFAGRYSSRTKFGSVEHNVKFVREQFRRFGVDEDITIVVGDASELLRLHPTIAAVRLFFIDADGRIDRDIGLMHDRLTADCVVVLDDIDNSVFLHPSESVVVVDQKHRIAHLLVTRFVEEGILVETGRIQGTGFYVLGAHIAKSARMNDIAIAAYRDLVFADVVRRGEKGKQPLRAWVARNVPMARITYRRFRSLLNRDAARP